MTPRCRSDNPESGGSDSALGTRLNPRAGLEARIPRVGLEEQIPRVGWILVVKIFSNLNLNGRTPPRVQPRVGEWGPEKVPTTKQKKRTRIYAVVALGVAMLACFLMGWYAYYAMTGCYGFGLGCRSK